MHFISYVHAKHWQQLKFALLCLVYVMLVLSPPERLSYYTLFILKSLHFEYLKT